MTLPHSLTYNPIDMVEHIFNDRSFELERRGINELAVEVQTRAAHNMLLFFAWEEHIKCLHISCMMEIETTDAGKSQIFELLALANEDLWLGHFSYWKEENMPLFKHSMLLENKEDISHHKLTRTINIAIEECERMYPAFKDVLQNGTPPHQSLYPLTLVTVGQA